MRSSSPRRFVDRVDAGRRLGTVLEALEFHEPIVLALPRGGVPVGREVAAALGCPLDILIVRKLGTPGRPELALGAIGEGGVRVLNQRMIRSLGVAHGALDEIESRERSEIERRARLYRSGRQRHDIAGKTAIVVDDGIATGATARAGCGVARELGAVRVVLAVPVAPADWDPGGDADDFVALLEPRSMRAVGEWYSNFTQTSDEEVIRLLTAADEAARE